MGQYFVFVNPDKKEFIDPESGAKLWEICVNSDAGILAYLLADGEKDGTGLLVATDKEEEKERLEKQGWKVISEYNEPHYWLMERITKYFGRWSGDRVVVAGDYGHSGLWDKAREEFKDITKEAYDEFYAFVGEEWMPPRKLRPDVAIVSQGVGNPPVVVEKPVFQEKPSS